MQEDINKKVIAVSCKAVKFTGGTLQKLLSALLKFMRNRHKKKVAAKQNDVKHGKQKLKTLQEQNRELTNIEITDENIKSFEKYAKKYSIDFSLMADKTQSPPRWYVFFKAQDTSLMKAAFKEYTNDKLVKKKPSVRRKLGIFRKKTRTPKPHQRTRQKSKGRGGMAL